MKHINTFSDFVLNESSYQFQDQAKKAIIDAMRLSTAQALWIYLGFSKKPELLKQLEDYANKIDGSTLESIIASHIQKNPADIHLLDKNPELKNKILKIANVEDFSKLGRLKKIGLI